MNNEREAFDAWLNEGVDRDFFGVRINRKSVIETGPAPELIFVWVEKAWQASRKVACDQVVAHFEGYTNPVAGHILAEQVKEILK